MKIINTGGDNVLLKNEKQTYILHPQETLTIQPSTRLIVYHDTNSSVSINKKKRERMLSELFFRTLYPYSITCEFHIMVGSEFDIQNINCDLLIIKNKTITKKVDGANVYYHLFELKSEVSTLRPKKNFIPDRDELLKKFTERHTSQLKKEHKYKFFNFPPIKSHMFLFFGGLLAITAIFYEPLSQQRETGTLIYAVCFLGLFFIYGFLRYIHFKKQIKPHVCTKELEMIFNLSFLETK